MGAHTLTPRPAASSRAAQLPAFAALSALLCLALLRTLQS